MTYQFIPYAEKLKDPRWQKKRLKILERDNWTCKHCGDTESTLHVHHLCYKGDPWEVSDKKLRTLCHACHEEEETYRDSRESDVLRALKKKGFDNGNLASLAFSIETMDEDIDFREAIVLIRYILSKDSIVKTIYNEKKIEITNHESKISF